MINIIIADDYHAVRDVIADYFFYYSTKISVLAKAKTGREALDLASNLRCDALLIDICLPELNGLEVIKRLREIKPYLLIIAFSGDKYSGYEEKSLAAGATYYIPKPYDLNILENMIIDYLDYQPCYQDLI